MPTDTKHGRYIPPGTDIARILKAVWRRQRSEVMRAIENGKEPHDLASWDQPISKLLNSHLTMYYHKGGDEGVRRIRRAVRNGGKSLKEFGEAGPIVHRRPTFRPLFVREKAAPVSVTVTDFNVFRPEVVSAVQSASFAFARSTNATATMQLRLALAELRRSLADGLQRGEALAKLTDRVNAIFANPQRAFAIAMTEASRAMHTGQLMAAQQNREIVKGKEWMASSDACEFCQSLDGTTVDLDEPFHVHAAGGPYATVDVPPGHPHCMCTWVEVL